MPRVLRMRELHGDLLDTTGLPVHYVTSSSSTRLLMKEGCTPQIVVKLPAHWLHVNKRLMVRRSNTSDSDVLGYCTDELRWRARTSAWPEEAIRLNFLQEGALCKVVLNLKITDLWACVVVLVKWCRPCWCSVSRAGSDLRVSSWSVGCCSTHAGNWLCGCVSFTSLCAVIQALLYVNVYTIPCYSCRLGYQLCNQRFYTLNSENLACYHPSWDRLRASHTVHSDNYLV